MAAGWSDNAVAGPSRAVPIVSDEIPQAAPSLFTWATRGKEPEVNVLRHPKPNTVQSLATSIDSLSLSLGSSHSSALPVSAGGNPSLLQSSPLRASPSAPSEELPPSAAPMAFQRADPRPFLPPSFQWVDLPNREFMCRAVAPMRPPPANEDLAIVSFDPLPGNVLNFGAVRNIIREFLISRHINPRDIMPCHLGQAYVRFNHAYERDQMVNESPMVFGNVNISFVKHNEGRNWRRVYFNDDCWVMMLGFPDDYKTERHIHNAVSDFGRLLLWEESNAFPGRIMARVRVTSAQGVPQFIVYSDSLNINGDSWTIQC